MSAEVVVLLNPLDTSRRRRYCLPDDTPLLAWVNEAEPALGALTRQVFVNARPCTDPAYRTLPHDEVLVAFAPTALTAAYYFVQVLITYAIAYVVNKLFAPKAPSAADVPSPSQVYGIAAPRNAARLGQPIPVVYGSVVSLPDFAAQPFVRFLNNDQYFYALLCVGQGEIDVSEMLFGQTSARPLAADVVQWRVFQPAAHRSTFGLIEAQIGGFAENLVTSPAVGDQELLPPIQTFDVHWYWALSGVSTTASPLGVRLDLAPSLDQKLALLPTAPVLGTTTVVATLSFNGSTYTVGTYTATAWTGNQNVPPGALVPPPTLGPVTNFWIGPFETAKAGTPAGRVLELDFVFPGGLYSSDSSGNLTDRSVTVTVGYTPIDVNGNVPAGVAEITYTETFTAHSNTPQRYSRSRALDPLNVQRFKVRVARTSATDGRVTVVERIIWAGMKCQLGGPAPGVPVYGNVTLIAVTMKATNGVAADAASSMRFRCTRRLRPLGDALTDTAPTVNPADAFVDILTAPYGGARPVNADELDLDDLAASRTTWAAHNGFNAVFDQPTTVWEALSASVQTVHAAPLPVGSRMALIHDQVQLVRSQLFTDANVVAGSLQVTQSFDATGTPAGVRVNYRDPISFSAQAVYDPPLAPDYTTVDLFGCTSASVAQEHADLTMAKRQRQRSSIRFDTELEGRLVLPGDRVAVQAGLVAWAQGARVESAAGLVLTLDTALVWTVGATHAVLLRGPTGVPVRRVGVARGATPYELVLPDAMPFGIVGANATQEATTLSFGVQDAEVTDWTVAKVTPNGDTVTIEGVNYDPTIYDGAAAFTRGEVLP